LGGTLSPRRHDQLGIGDRIAIEFFNGGHAINLKAAVEVSAGAHFGGPTAEMPSKGPRFQERGDRRPFT